MAIQYNGPCLNCLGDFGVVENYPPGADYYVPGNSGIAIQDTQTNLIAVGFSVVASGTYDAPTSAAVLEFRGATGLPYVNQIDQAFNDRLATEVGGGIDTGRPRKNAPVGPDINISGRLPAGAMGFGLLLLVGYLATRKKK